VGLRRALLSVLVGFTFLIPLSQASSDAPSTPQEVVAGVAAAYKVVNTVKADFTQIRTDPVTGQKDTEKGHLSLKRPKKMRFDFVSPQPRTFVTNGKTLWIYDPTSKQVIEQEDLGGNSGMGVLLDDLSKLDDLFTTTLLPDDKPPKPTVTLHLVPKKDGVFQSLDLTLTRQKYVLQDLDLVDPMGAHTEMHFANVRFDVDVPDTDFDFVPPPGVQVVKAGGTP
jgi:outer membrane lipoprotein carrier protein